MSGDIDPWMQAPDASGLVPPAAPPVDAGAARHGLADLLADARTELEGLVRSRPIEALALGFGVGLLLASWRRS